MNLTDLQKEAHAIAQDQGWYDTESTFGEFIALIHSELSGALEAYRERGFDIWVEPRVAEKDPRPPAWERAAFTHDLFSKPCGVASDLAGVVIRVADMAEHYGWHLGALADGVKQLFQQEPSRLVGLDIFGYWLTKCHGALSMAFSMMELDDPYHKEGAGCVMAKFVVMIEHMGIHYGIDLDAAINAKMEYYRTRGYRHGGKAL